MAKVNKTIGGAIRLALTFAKFESIDVHNDLVALVNELDTVTETIELEANEPDLLSLKEQLLATCVEVLQSGSNDDDEEDKPALIKSASDDDDDDDVPRFGVKNEDDT